MRKLPIVIVVALLAAGCDGGSAGAKAPVVRPSSQAPVTSPPSTTARLRRLPPELNFDAQTLDGKPFTGVDLVEKPVVFWFWAPSCPQCLSEGPNVAKVAKRYEGRVAFVGVAGLGSDRGQVASFLARTGTGGLTQLDDSSGALSKHFEVTSQSAFLFMKADGSGERASGPLGEGDLERRVGKLAGA